MNRKTFKYKIGEGQYTFSERNKEDVDYYSFQDKLREHNCLFHQRVQKDPDERLQLTLFEMKQVYTPEQITTFMMGFEQQKNMCYDSFKIANPEISFDEFNKLMPGESVYHVMRMIVELEKPDTVNADVKKKKPVNRSQSK